MQIECRPSDNIRRAASVTGLVEFSRLSRTPNDNEDWTRETSQGIDFDGEKCNPAAQKRLKIAQREQNHGRRELDDTGGDNGLDRARRVRRLSGGRLKPARRGRVEIGHF